MLFRHKRHVFNQSIRVLLSTNSLIRLAAAMLGPIYALFVQEIGGNLLDASIAGAVFACSAGVTVLLTGKMIDKHGKPHQILLVGYLFIGLGFFSYAFATTFVHLLLIQILIGFGEAIASPAFDVLYSKHLDHGRAGTEWGAWEAMNYMTMAIGALIGGVIANAAGFSVLFIIMALLCVLSVLTILLLPKKILS